MFDNRILRHIGVLCVSIGVVSCGENEGSQSGNRISQKNAGFLGALSDSRTDSDHEKNGREKNVETRRTLNSTNDSLGRLPSDTLLCWRLRKTEDVHLAFGELAIAKAFEHFDFNFFLEQLNSGIREFESGFIREFPEASELLKLAKSWRGEMTCALLRVHPGAVMTGRDFPVSAVVYVDLGDQRDAFVTLLGSAIKRLSSIADVKILGDNHYQFSESQVLLDVRVIDGRLAAWVGPEANATRELEALHSVDVQDSFLASKVFQNTRPFDEGAVTCMETYVNLEPIWQLVTMMAPPEAQSALGSTRLDKIAGFSFMAALKGEGFLERMTLVSPGHQDLISGFWNSESIDPRSADYMQDDANAGAAWSFDLGAAFASLMKKLPPEGSQEIEREVSSFEKGMGLDLESDILAHIGPQYSAAMSGDLMEAFTENKPFDAVMSIGVGDKESISKLLSFMTKGLEQEGEVKTRQVEGEEVVSVILNDSEIPEWFQPTYGFVGGRFLLASSSKAFEGVSAQVRDDSRTNEAFFEHLKLAGDSTVLFTAQSTPSQVQTLWGALLEAVPPEIDSSKLPSSHELQRFFADSPDSVTRFQKTPEGWCIDSNTTLGSSWASLAPLGILAAVAIPNLFTARLSANESAAIATLRNLSSAQAQVQAMGIIDVDGDGIGEYATFAELSGAIPLRGGDGDPLDPPFMSAAFRLVMDSCIERNGYAFRVYLPSKSGQALQEMVNGGAPKGVDSDEAEVGWLAYAWPMNAGKTGNRVFVIDQDGDMYFFDNQNQSYSGIESPPTPESGFTTESPFSETSKNQAMKTGRDGNTWQAMQ